MPQDLEEVLRGAKPEGKPGGWKESDVRSVKAKLESVDIDTTEKLEEALKKGNLNTKLKNFGHIQLKGDTLQDLRTYLGVEARPAKQKARPAEKPTPAPPAAAKAPAAPPPAEPAPAAAKAPAAAPAPAPKAPGPEAWSRGGWNVERVGVAATGGLSPSADARSAADVMLALEARKPTGGSAAWQKARDAEAAALEGRSQQRAARAPSPARSEESDEIMLASEVRGGSPKAGDHDNNAETIPSLRMLLMELDDAPETEVAEAQARDLGIDVERLAERAAVVPLVDSLVRLKDSTLKEMCEKCERLGLASCSTLPKDELRSILREGLIWDELSEAALREECNERGLVTDSTWRRRSREELLAWLADSTWEAVGVPVRRFASRHDARLALAELRREATASPEKLEKHSEQFRLPTGLPQKLLLDWMKKIIIWKWLPVSELRNECLEKGLVPEEPPKAAGAGDADVERSYYLMPLLVALRRERCQAAGVPDDRVGGLQEAEIILQDIDRHQKLDIAALKAEAAKFDLPVPKEETEEERQVLLRLLKDVLIWCRLPLESLKGECRERDVAFPEVFAPAQGDIPKDLFVAGSWTDFVPVKMNKVGSTRFRHTLEIGEQGEETFQLLLEGTAEKWSKVLYPSVADANPHVSHCVLGPNDEGHGKNWSIGVHKSDSEFSKPGAKCTIMVSFEDDLPTVSWGSAGPVSSILQKRPATASQAASQKPQATAPRQFKGGERRERWERIEPAKKQAIKELAKQEALLRSLRADGIPVQCFTGPALKKLLDDCAELDDCKEDDLLAWYTTRCGFPVEAEMEHKELLQLIKRTTAWQAMPFNSLKKECERLPHFSNSMLDETDKRLKEGTEHEQRGYFVDKLVDQDRMVAWEARGYQALRIGSVDTVISMIMEMERIKALPEEELKELWVAADLPEEDCSAPKEQIFATLKKLLVWVNLDLPALQGECKETSLPINTEGAKGQTDDQLKQDLLAQLKVGRFQKTYEARGLLVQSLGLLKTSQVLGAMERYKAMDLAELRASYEGEQNFLPADTPRETMLSFIQDVSVWEALSIKDLMSVAEERGIPMVGFRLDDPFREKDPAVNEQMRQAEMEAKVREDVVDRLILREHLMRARRSLEPPQRNSGPPNSGPLSAWPQLEDGAQPAPQTAEATEAAEATDARKNPAVWKLIQKMRDPFVAERITCVARKDLPTSTWLPASAQQWRPIEAALRVLSCGKFDPDKHGRKAAPSAASGRPGGRLLSVVCPTSDSRQNFHRLLYRCYKEQDYENKELIVVDSGTRQSEFFKKLNDDSVFYYFFDVEDSREGQKSSKVAWSLGLKRNIACCLARGDVLAHFDDDDLYAPGYLSWMQRQLRVESGDDGSPKPAAAKLTEWYLLDVNTLTFRYLDVFTDANVPAKERRGWLYGWGFSYIFTRSAWELAPFPDVEFAEDIGFLEGLMAENVPVRLVELPHSAGPGGQGADRGPTIPMPQGLVAHSCHAGSTSGGEFDGRKRSGRSVAAPGEVKDLLRTVKEITNAQKAPIAGSRQHLLFNRFSSGTGFGGGKIQQPSFRIGGNHQPFHTQPFHSFGLAPNMLRPGAKSAAR